MRAAEWARNVPETIDVEEEAAFFAPLGRAAKAVATPFASVALNVTAPAGRLARAAVLRRAPRPERTLGDLGKHLEALGRALRRAAADRRRGPRAAASG